jgi:hypothetical protein
VSYFAMAAVALAGAVTSPSFAQSLKLAAEKPATTKATFAGGCFWCVEEALACIIHESARDCIVEGSDEVCCD